MQRLSILLLLHLLFSTTVSAQKLKQFKYTIEPVIDGNQSHFNITIEFKQKQAGAMRFLLPQIWGVEDSREYIELKTINNAKYTQSDSSISLTYEKNAAIKIKYIIHSAVSDSIPVRGQEYLPVIKPTYFTLFTNSGFLIPEDNSAKNFNFIIRWKNYPEQYLAKPITSFGDGLTQKLDYATPLDLQNGILVGGDYRLYESVNEKKQTTYLAIRGKWSFSDNELERSIESTLKQQRQFWDDYSSKRFLVTFSPMGYENELSMSYVGTGLQNSFAVLAMCNNSLHVSDLSYLFHHELMHHWIGNQIQNGVDEELSYWFSEGFTDYFSRKNMFESGVVNTAQYYAILDSVFAIHYNNPLAIAHNDSIKANFWGGTYYGKLPYNRGSIFAYYLDGKIQTISKGQYDLKAVMRSMLSETKLEKRPFSWLWLKSETQKLVNYDISADIDKYIFNGELIPIDELNKNLKNSIELRPTKIPSSGFTTTKDADTGKMYITTIEENTGIATTNLKVGDQVKGYSIYGSVHQESEIYIYRDGKDITITFFPYALSKPLPQHKK